MKNLILASQSPRRKQILSLITDNKIEVIPANIPEKAFSALARTPDELVTKLAQSKAKKALAIILGAKKDKFGPDFVIVAGDTVGILVLNQDNWQILEKPENRQQAKEMLLKMRDREHYIFSGVCVLNPISQQVLLGYQKSTVIFRNFSQKDLDKYLDSNKWQDKAGSYGIQDPEFDFVKSFEGSFTNIVGLPVEKTVDLLTQAGIKIKTDWQKIITSEFKISSDKL